jgi:hypothetical protein
MLYSTYREVVPRTKRSGIGKSRASGGERKGCGVRCVLGGAASAGNNCQAAIAHAGLTRAACAYVSSVVTCDSFVHLHLPHAAVAGHILAKSRRICEIRVIATYSKRTNASRSKSIGYGRRSVFHDRPPT